MANMDKPLRVTRETLTFLLEPVEAEELSDTMMED
jgi:hypothetical protein